MSGTGCWMLLLISTTWSQPISVSCAVVRCGNERKAAAEAAEYLVVVQVVGKTSDEELVRGIWNDGGDDACGDDKQQNEIVAFQLGDT